MINSPLSDISPHTRTQGTLIHLHHDTEFGTMFRLMKRYECGDINLEELFGVMKYNAGDGALSTGKLTVPIR